jgi:hypothetical protein
MPAEMPPIFILLGIAISKDREFAGVEELFSAISTRRVGLNVAGALFVPSLDWQLLHCQTRWLSHETGSLEAKGCRPFVRVALSEEGVLLFVLPYREPKEDGGRNATGRGRPFANRGVVTSGARFLPSPSLCGNSGAGKIGRQNSPVRQHCKPRDGGFADG